MHETKKGQLEQKRRGAQQIAMGARVNRKLALAKDCPAGYCKKSVLENVTHGDTRFRGRLTPQTRLSAKRRIHAEAHNKASNGAIEKRKG